MRFIAVLGAAIAGVLCAQNVTPVLRKNLPPGSGTVTIPKLNPDAQYSLLYSIESLRRLSADTRITVELRQDATTLLRKTLHAGDPDYYTQFRVPHSGDALLTIQSDDIASAVPAQATLQVNRWPLSSQIKAGPNHRWQDAMPIELGKTVFASGDDSPYIPLPGVARRAQMEDPAGEDWYRFDFSGPSKLLFAQLELTERDQLPVDLSIFRVQNGKVDPYFEGEDPVTLPHEAQALPGNKFAPRLLKEPGTYYVRVRANHPEYKLRTRLYDAPPYTDPHQAVRTALDYILAAGDSWHANTPRRGGILERVSSVHQETSLCVACHATQFPLRAQLYATRNGYPVVQRSQLQFLTERVYNNPRPFYGFEQSASWARMISAPANVLGRMSHLIDLFEEQVSGERREPFHRGINGYLQLYYAGREKLPPDETNGNTPLVSAHEVAWYAWDATKDPRLGPMIAGGPVKNVIDLCYQTLAMADIDRAQYSAQIAKNAERILSLQRPDGQWSARFEANQQEVEFQTGHALWALQAAGIPAENPQVAKGLQYLMKRQQVFGGWMDPLQSFENFRTPFRETQMSALALSSYYPLAGREKGWNSAHLTSLSSEPVTLLNELDGLWDKPNPQVRKQLEAATRSNDVLIRQAAVEALGRLGESSDSYDTLLGDPSKLVQRTAAWALRQSYSRHPETPSATLTAALASPNDRVRWGATRVFAAHFASLASRPEIAQALAGRIDEPVIATRMNVVKGLWQLWFWTSDVQGKGLIEDTVLTALGKPQSAWVERNLHDAVYNMADENIRYLYNNWVPLLGREPDREQATRGRLTVEARLADKFAEAITHGSELQKRELLAALTEFPLRRGDIYDLDADQKSQAPPVYNRIGNDVEQIAFFGESRDKIAGALRPLLESSDTRTRHLAQTAALLVRDTRFPETNRIAGPAGPATTQFLAKIKQTPEAAVVARALNPAPVNAVVATAAGTVHSSAKLDEPYFRGYVEPILQTRGKDGYACVNCHATHTLFDGTWSTVRNVVDTANPERSLILRKPTSTSESEGVANSKDLAHGGGVRFANGSKEYQTILDWIKGAKD